MKRGLLPSLVRACRPYVVPALLFVIAGNVLVATFMAGDSCICFWGFGNHDPLDTRDDAAGAL